MISLSSWRAGFLVNLHNFLEMLLSSKRKYIFIHNDFSAAMLFNGASKRCMTLHNVKGGSNGNIIDHHQHIHLEGIVCSRNSGPSEDWRTSPGSVQHSCLLYGPISTKQAALLMPFWISKSTSWKAEFKKILPSVN